MPVIPSDDSRSVIAELRSWQPRRWWFARELPVGAILGFFAFGCAVCNKLVLLALGYAGALQFFEPAQPYLAEGPHASFDEHYSHTEVGTSA